MTSQDDIRGGGRNDYETHNPGGASALRRFLLLISSVYFQDYLQRAETGRFKTRNARIWSKYHSDTIVILRLYTLLKGNAVKGNYMHIICILLTGQDIPEDVIVGS